MVDPDEPGLSALQLDRLLRGRWAAPAWDEQYTYSPVGNLLSKQVGTSAAQAYSYGDSAHVHAVTGALGNAYVYDANGSMVSRGSQSVSYDPERRPVRLEQGGQVAWRAVYDGDGVRRKRVDANGTVHYLGAYERNVGNGQDTTEATTTYYTALGRLLAYRQTTTPPGGASTSVLRWVGVDHLGSTIRVADGSFAPLSNGSQRYTPFGVGREAATGLGTDHRYTGQIEDASTAQGGSALYWYTSRAYDPALGRFVCPDTIVPEPGNPQSLNRYSYVRNNPLIRVDPTGHYDLLQEDERARWLNDHQGWDLRHEDGFLFAYDPAGYRYDLAIMYEDAFDGSRSYWFTDSRMISHPGNDEWDYIFRAGVNVLVRNNVDNENWSYPYPVPSRPNQPRALVDDLAKPDLSRPGGKAKHAIVLAFAEIWSNDEVLMNSAWLNHELAHVAQQIESARSGGGLLGYGAGYVAQWGLAGLSHDNVYERDADQRAGLPYKSNEFFDLSTAQGSYRYLDPRSNEWRTWHFRLPRGL